VAVATLQECEQAFADLADKLAGDPAARNKAALDRSVSCTLTDLKVIFAGQLRDGGLHNVHQASTGDAQIKLTMTSDDLVALNAGQLNLVSAWTSGRVKIDASVFDLLKLRNAF
jgi:alkyl sulfatase BDS1-like metallo-beta-lactamase superfamily hydrolase